MNLFIAKAREEGRNAGWMYTLGVFFSLVCGQMLGMIPLIYLMIENHTLSGDILSHPERYGLNKNSLLVLILFPFVVSLLILLLFIRLFHHKRILVSFTPFSSINWKKIFTAFFLWFLLSLVSFGIFYLRSPAEFSFYFAGSDFLILLGISLLILPLQTTYEELLFRSYLMQGIGIRAVRAIVPLCITSVLFGLMHIFNPEVGQFGYELIIDYIAIGFLLGLLTLLSESTELALGLHAANNIFAALILGIDNSVLNTDALFHTSMDEFGFVNIAMDLVQMTVFFLIARALFRFKPFKTLWEKPEESQPIDRSLPGAPMI